MKKRKSFVSNSSSTSFIFNFKTNDKNQCINIINKYKERFNLSDVEFGYVSSDEVFQEIKKNFDEVKDINILISEYKAIVKEFGKDLNQNPIINNISSEYEKKIKKLIDLKKKGFNYYYIIDFGDHHGYVSGGKIGYVMDYVGKEINISEDDLIMFTEQNR